MESYSATIELQTSCLNLNTPAALSQTGGYSWLVKSQVLLYVTLRDRKKSFQLIQIIFLGKRTHTYKSGKTPSPRLFIFTGTLLNISRKLSKCIFSKGQLKNDKINFLRSSCSHFLSFIIIYTQRFFSFQLLVNSFNLILQQPVQAILMLHFFFLLFRFCSHTVALSSPEQALWAAATQTVSLACYRHSAHIPSHQRKALGMTLQNAQVHILTALIMLSAILHFCSEWEPLREEVKLIC